jgi:class 3 adenylate cyclase
MKKKFPILFVDDEEYNLVAFKATFREDYDIYTAQSGKEALEIIKGREIGLIITDQRMPEMTGVELLEKILPKYPDAVRIILTGYSDVEAIVSAINNGNVFRYITKPWDERELKMTIENALRLYELRIKNKELVSELQVKVQEQEKTLLLFQKYVPESIVTRTLSQSDESIFEGDTRNVAVLFCDIRGFTPMSEEMSPKEVVSFLNKYYSSMNAVIKRHNGTVTQFVGDEIFATFGAPLQHPDNEKSAVFCALDMLEVLPKIKEETGKDFVVGIGINAGEVVTGNLGSEDRIDYSVTGDTVNTGKRIEMLTKENPNSIIISDTVYEKVKNVVDTHALPPQIVKGKKEALIVYELNGKYK